MHWKAILGRPQHGLMRWNFVMKHARGAGLIPRPVDQQSITLPLNYLYPHLPKTAPGASSPPFYLSPTSVVCTVLLRREICLITITALVECSCFCKRVKPLRATRATHVQFLKDDVSIHTDNGYYLHQRLCLYQGLFNATWVSRGEGGGEGSGVALLLNPEHKVIHEQAWIRRTKHDPEHFYIVNIWK